MTTYRFFPSTDGPSTPVDFGAGFEFVSATGFCVTGKTLYFEGFWWWVCPAQQSTAPQTFCLWQDTGDADQKGDFGAVVEASVVTSGALVAGQWNFIPLPAPIPLTQYVSYRAATASLRYAPATNGQFGAGRRIRRGHHERTALRVRGRHIRQQQRRQLLSGQQLDLAGEHAEPHLGLPGCGFRWLQRLD